MVTLVEDSTRLVFTAKVQLVDPAAMVALDGTLATLELLLESATRAALPSARNFLSRAFC